MMSVMANMQGLQHLELKGNIGISGPLPDSSPSTSSGLQGLKSMESQNNAAWGSLVHQLLPI
jgi:hypothetical protein